MIEYTEIQQFKTNKIQSKTLKTLRKKYKINVSEFIRIAINEKLNREKDSLFKHYSDIHNYLKSIEECPF